MNLEGKKTMVTALHQKILTSFLLKKLPEDDTNLYQANQTSHNNLTQGVKLYSKVRHLKFFFTNELLVK